MADKFSQYARKPNTAQNNTDKFAQYQRPIKEASNDGLLNRTDKNILIGLANLGQTVANAPRNIVDLISPEIAAKMPRSNYDFAAGFNQPEKEASDIFTQTISEIGPSIFIPGSNLGRFGQLIGKIPGAGKYIRAGLGEAIPQTAFSTIEALENSPENVGQIAALTGGMAFPLGAAGKAIEAGSPVLKATGRATMAGAGGYLGHELGSATGVPGLGETSGLIGAVLGGKGINVNRNAQQTIFAGLSPDEARELVEASRRLGLEFVTPGEAIANPFLAGEHARVGKTREGAKELYAAGKRRVESEEKSIMRLFDDIYTEGKLAPEKKKLYEDALNTYLPDEIGLEFIESSTINDAAKKLKKDPIYQDLLTNKNYDENTVGYWNQIKRVLDGQYAKTKDTTKKALIDDARKQIINTIDEIKPEYKTARSIAEREFIREDLNKVFNKNEITLNRFNEFLKNKEEFNKIRSRLSAFPEIQQTLDDMRLVAPRLQNFNPTNKTTAALEKTGMSTARNAIDAARDFFQRNVYGKEDVEAVKLMTSPQWLEKLEALSATGGKPRQAEELFNFAIGGQYPGMNEAIAAYNKQRPASIPNLTPQAQAEGLEFFAGNPMLAQWIKYLGRGATQGTAKAMEQ